MVKSEMSEFAIAVVGAVIVIIVLLVTILVRL